VLPPDGQPAWQRARSGDQRSAISCPFCRKRRPTSPCSTAPAASRQIATARHRGGSVLRSRAGPISPPLSAGYGDGQRCAIANGKGASNRLRNQFVGYMHAHNELTTLNRLLTFTTNDTGDGELHNYASVQMWCMLQLLAARSKRLAASTPDLATVAW
jgi:hypothetical protein